MCNGVTYPYPYKHNQKEDKYCDTAHGEELLIGNRRDYVERTKNVVGPGKMVLACWAASYVSRCSVGVISKVDDEEEERCLLASVASASTGTPVAPFP